NVRYYGTALPPYYGSFIQELCYRRFSLSFLLSFKWGHYFQKNTINYKTLFDGWIGHHDYERRWQQPGDETSTTIPSMTYPAVSNRDRFYAASEPNIVRGDLLRLQDISLSYAWESKRLA